MISLMPWIRILLARNMHTVPYQYLHGAAYGSLYFCRISLCLYIRLPFRPFWVFSSIFRVLIAGCTPLQAMKYIQDSLRELLKFLMYAYVC